jgi:hypothetical protein
MRSTMSTTPWRCVRRPRPGPRRTTPQTFWPPYARRATPAALAVVAPPGPPD